jgi:DNA-binding transcriptional LysR family regulator
VPPPVRDLDLAELQTFCVAADLGTLGRAARRLGVSQPALSKRLAHLEQRAGAELLERTPQGVRLTAAGRRLYEEARPLLEQAAVVEEALASLSHATRPVRVAASHSATEALVGRALARISAEHLAIELVVLNSDRVRMRVANGKADLGVAAALPGTPPHPGTREEILAGDEIVVAVPLAHPWARRTSITREEFLAEPMVVRDPTSNARITVDAVLARERLTAADPLAELSTPQAVKQEARERRAALLLSRRVMQGDLNYVVLEVEGLRFPRAFVAVLPERGELTPRVRAVLDRIHERAAGEEPAGEAAHE